MIKWIKKLLTPYREAIELRQEIEELTKNAINVFDLNIIWAKLIIFAQMEDSTITEASRLRDKVLLRELIIQKDQAIVLAESIKQTMV